MRDYHYSCRKCTGRCIRHGKSKNKQRWKCIECGTTQFRVYKPSTINAERKRIMKRLSCENVGIRGIARLLSISPTHVIRCLLQMASLVKRPDYYEYGQEYELDELWSYSECKKNQQWVVWAINRKTRVVIDFVVGPGAMPNPQLLTLIQKSHSQIPLKRKNGFLFRKPFR